MSLLLTDSSCIIYMNKWVFMPLCFIQDLKNLPTFSGKKNTPPKKTEPKKPYPKPNKSLHQTTCPTLLSEYFCLCDQETFVYIKKFLYT